MCLPARLSRQPLSCIRGKGHLGYTSRYQQSNNLIRHPSVPLVEGVRSNVGEEMDLDPICHLSCTSCMSLRFDNCRDRQRSCLYCLPPNSRKYPLGRVCVHSRVDVCNRRRECSLLCQHHRRLLGYSHLLLHLHLPRVPHHSLSPFSCLAVVAAEGIKHRQNQDLFHRSKPLLVLETECLGLGARGHRSRIGGWRGIDGSLSRNQELGVRM